jgi:hypothetical protein
MMAFYSSKNGVFGCAQVKTFNEIIKKNSS